MADDFPGLHPLNKLVDAWLKKIDKAVTAKSWWQDIADECMLFYSSANDFMWSEKYRKKFTSGDQMNPRFRITIAKAFELVALFGPVLYYRNPVRQVNPRKPFELSPELYGDPNDPAVQQFFQQQVMQQQQGTLQDRMRSQLLSEALNYMPNEMPGGGLATHCQNSINEALIKGRGVTWCEPYYYPSTDRMIVGSFYDTVDHLQIDPDAETIESAMWIARKCIHPVWKVEDDYGYPRGFLKNRSGLESAWSQGEGEGNVSKRRRDKKNESNDLLPYWKIYSKMGVGARLTGMSGKTVEQLDELLGDHVYLAVAKGIPFPLNVPSEMAQAAIDALAVAAEETMPGQPPAEDAPEVSDLAEAFQWPVPFWRDDRWPCAMLDFYALPRSVWPVAPLAPALGVLKAINIVMSHLLNRTWSSSRDFICILKAAGEDIKEKILQGDDQTLLELESNLGKTINEIVTFLQQPPANTDIWRVLEWLIGIFEKMSGLTELAYGMSGRQMRSAAEADKKYEQMSIRPDHMAKQVEQWATEQARMEAMCLRWFFTGDDMEGIKPGTKDLWDQLVAATEPDKVVREMEYRIEAGSTRKPNLDRDTENINNGLQFLLPMFQQYATITGDSSPLNAINEMWGKAVQFDGSKLVMQPWIPIQLQMQMQQPPPPEGQPADGAAPPPEVPPEQIPPEVAA